ncbi:MAG: M3 family metallopeptidase, partial [bacterium]
SQLMSLMSSSDKPVRDEAATAFNEILAKHIDVATEEINSILENKKINDELRGMERPDQGRHLSDDIDSFVVDALLEAVKDRFTIAQEFYQLKAQLFGVQQLKYHERNVPYGQITKKYPFEDSVRLVQQVCEKLDSEFASIFKGFVDNGQLDVFPRKGKTSGAFCAHHLITQPTYILLNHTDKLNDVLTLAHELGHGINNELIKQKQHALYFGTPLSTAEVASTFMEDFVLQEINAEANEEERLAIMMMKLNDDISSIFRQVACYRFEQALHESFREKGYLSKEDIGALFREHMLSYMGDAVEASEGSQNWWVYWSHIRSFFYVYSYASGLLISKSLQNSVRKDPQFIEKVKGFFSAGMSDSPKNIFNNLGINIADKAFWQQGLDEIEALLKETKELAEKLGKR